MTTKPLNERCLLVSVTINLPTKNKQDKQITGEVIASHNASHDAGRWVKKLYPGDIIKPAEQLSGAIRQLVYARSLPWTQDGQRMLPCAAMLDLQTELNKLVTEFETEADKAAGRFDAEVESARVRDNGLFKREAYPVNAQVFRKSFGVTVKFLPMPDTQHVILDMAEDEVRMVKESVAQQVTDAVQEARADLLRRMTEPVKAMVERLSAPDAIFRDSLVENVQEIARLIPQLNLTDDPALHELGKEIESLGQTFPQTLRASKRARQDTASKAQAILAKLEKV